MGGEMARVPRETTTVAIVGAGVSGLTAAMLLRRSGVGCVVLERQSRGYVEQRQRAGVVEYRGVRMFQQWGPRAIARQIPGGQHA
jgi:p-hydroxybenzoate 3-monooxygenase